MLRYLALLMVMVVMLAACGSSSDTEDAPADDTADETVEETVQTEDDTPQEDTPQEDEPFVLTVTGAETFEFEADPLYSCVNDQIQITTFTQSPKLDIYLPSSIEPGTYALADFDSSAETSYVDGMAVIAVTGEVISGSGSTYGSFYFTNGTGELVIESVPSELGERFVATFDVTLENGDGETINATGNLDLLESGSASMDCASY